MAVKFLSTGEAAKRLGVNERHVRLLLDEGRLAGQKIGGRWIVDAAALRKYRKHPTMGRPKAHATNDLGKSQKSGK